MVQRMVSKKIFIQNGRTTPQQRFGVRAAIPYKKPYKSLSNHTGDSFNQLLYNTSQIPDNPGYMDFNNPTPPVNGNHSLIRPMPDGLNGKKKVNNKFKQKNKPFPQTPHTPQKQPFEWSKNNNHNNMKLQHKNEVVLSPRYKGNNVQAVVGLMPCPMQRPLLAGAGGNRPRRMILPPPLPIAPGVIRGGLRPPIPPPPHSFQPQIIPPIRPMVHCGRMPPPIGVQPPPFMRRNGRGRHLPPRPPPPMPPMRAPFIQAIPPIPPVPYNGINKIKKPDPKIVKKVVKVKSNIKTLKNLLNQYPIDKPWVTEEIRKEYNKKIEFEDRLKGNKDDELFAKFKAQHDKFVGMYELSREEYFKKEAAAIKDCKESKNKTAAKNGKSKDAIPKSINKT